MKRGLEDESLVKQETGIKEVDDILFLIVQSRDDILFSDTIQEKEHKCQILTKDLERCIPPLQLCITDFVLIHLPKLHMLCAHKLALVNSTDSCKQEFLKEDFAPVQIIKNLFKKYVRLQEEDSSKNLNYFILMLYIMGVSDDNFEFSTIVDVCLLPLFNTAGGGIV